MIGRLIRINRKAQEGYNSVSWLINTVSGSSLVTIALTELHLPILVSAGSGGVVALSLAAYWLIGDYHERRNGFTKHA